MQKKKKYIVARSFWRDGILLPIGQDLWLFSSEAKYLKHALTDPDAPVAPAPAAEVDPKPARTKRVKAEGPEDGAE
jgi:hypothetical protein